MGKVAIETADDRDEAGQGDRLAESTITIYPLNLSMVDRDRLVIL
ncbi:MAG: hypothetical protein ACLQNE_19175 [Thermoguttaceae bacterium]